MFQRRQRKFRRRSNGRNRMSHMGGGMQSKLGTNSFTNGQAKNNFRNSLSVEKLFEKYNSLAKEAISAGDKTLAENYLQHADHFERIISHKNLNQKENNSQVTNIIKEKSDNPFNNSTPSEDQTIKSKE